MSFFVSQFPFLCFSLFNTQKRIQINISSIRINVQVRPFNYISVFFCWNLGGSIPFVWQRENIILYFLTKMNKGNSKKAQVPLKCKWMKIFLINVLSTLTLINFLKKQKYNELMWQKYQLHACINFWHRACSYSTVFLVLLKAQHIITLIHILNNYVSLRRMRARQTIWITI